MANRVVLLKVGDRVRLTNVERPIAWCRGRTGTVTDVKSDGRANNYFVCVKLDVVHDYERETIPFKRDHFYLLRDQMEKIDA